MKLLRKLFRKRGRAGGDDVKKVCSELQALLGHDVDVWDVVDTVLEHCDIVAWPVDEEGEEVVITLPTFKYFVRHLGEIESQPGLSRPTLKYIYR